MDPSELGQKEGVAEVAEADLSLGGHKDPGCARFRYRCVSHRDDEHHHEYHEHGHHFSLEEIQGKDGIAAPAAAPVHRFCGFRLVQSGVLPISRRRSNHQIAGQANATRESGRGDMQ